MMSTQSPVQMSYGYSSFVGQKMGVNTLSRIGDDSTVVTERTKQSTDQTNWRLSNFHLPSPNPVERVAVDEVMMTSKDGYGPGGRVIDTESDLKITSVQIRPNVPMRHQPRPITTVPYMGAGRGNPFVESLLHKSEHIRDKKSESTVTDSFFRQQYTPMIPHLSRNIQNPENYIEALNDPGWVRGGASSRNLVRDRLCEQDSFRQ